MTALLRFHALYFRRSLVFLGTRELLGGLFVFTLILFFSVALNQAKETLEAAGLPVQGPTGNWAWVGLVLVFPFILFLFAGSWIGWMSALPLSHALPVGRSRFLAFFVLAWGLIATFLVLLAHGIAFLIGWQTRIFYGAQSALVLISIWFSIAAAPLAYGIFARWRSNQELPKAASQGDRPARSGSVPGFWTIVRSCNGNFLSYFNMFFLLQTMLMAWLTPEASMSFYFYLMIGGFLQLNRCLAGWPFLMHTPIPRRRAFGALVVPVLASVLLIGLVDAFLASRAPLFSNPPDFLIPPGADRDEWKYETWGEYGFKESESHGRAVEKLRRLLKGRFGVEVSASEVGRAMGQAGPADGVSHPGRTLDAQRRIVLRLQETIEPRIRRALFERYLFGLMVTWIFLMATIHLRYSPLRKSRPGIESILFVGFALLMGGMFYPSPWEPHRLIRWGWEVYQAHTFSVAMVCTGIAVVQFLSFYRVFRRIESDDLDPLRWKDSWTRFFKHTPQRGKS